MYLRILSILPLWLSMTAPLAIRWNISPTMEITNPHSGVTWVKGQNQTISWYVRHSPHIVLFPGPMEEHEERSSLLINITTWKERHELSEQRKREQGGPGAGDPEALHEREGRHTWYVLPSAV